MEKMDTLMDICGDLTSLAPTGMKEYLQFNLAVFKASDKAVKIIDRHSEKIEAAVTEASKLADAIGTTKVNAYSGREAVRYDDTDDYFNKRAK